NTTTQSISTLFHYTTLFRSRDYSPKTGQNIKVELSAFPSQPVAGKNTQMRFNIAPGDALEKYLGAWGHMLAASDDLIDMMHTHPDRKSTRLNSSHRTISYAV